MLTVYIYIYIYIYLSLSLYCANWVFSHGKFGSLSPGEASCNRPSVYVIKKPKSIHCFLTPTNCQERKITFSPAYACSTFLCLYILLVRFQSRLQSLNPVCPLLFLSRNVVKLHMRWIYILERTQHKSTVEIIYTTDRMYITLFLIAYMCITHPCVREEVGVFFNRYWYLIIFIFFFILDNLYIYGEKEHPYNFH